MVILIGLTGGQNFASMETRGGFIEIRNKNWEVVGKVADPDSLLTLDQIKGDFAGFEQA